MFFQNKINHGDKSIEKMCGVLYPYKLNHKEKKKFKGILKTYFWHALSKRLTW